MNYNFYGDCFAAEDLVNNTICIKEGNEIRNINHYSELETHLFVFVSNIPHTGHTYKEIIKENQPVRYFKMKI